MTSADDDMAVLDLGFTFTFFGKDYNQVSISTNGYVCLGNTSDCWYRTRPSPFDIIVGLNLDLDTRRNKSGQIYYKNLSSNLDAFRSSSKIYLNLFNPEFEPAHILMITFDNVLPFDNKNLLKSRVSFQIFLAADSSKNSYVIFKYISCPSDFPLYSSSGFTHDNAGSLQEIILPNDQMCVSSNIGQTGIWISEVTVSGIYKKFLY